MNREKNSQKSNSKKEWLATKGKNKKGIFNFQEIKGFPAKEHKGKSLNSFMRCDGSCC